MHTTQYYLFGIFHKLQNKVQDCFILHLIILKPRFILFYILFIFHGFCPLEYLCSCLSRQISPPAHALIIMFNCLCHIIRFIRCIQIWRLWYSVLEYLHDYLLTDKQWPGSHVLHAVQLILETCKYLVVSIFNRKTLRPYIFADYNGIVNVQLSIFNCKTYTIPVFSAKKLGINVITSALLYMGSSSSCISAASSAPSMPLFSS